MKLTKQDIKEQKDVGVNKKGHKITFIKTHGGYCIAAEVTNGGQVNIMGSGPNRAEAIHQARRRDPHIVWDEALNKAEIMEFPDGGLAKDDVKLESPSIDNSKKDTFGKPILESTPDNHYSLAAHHSKMAGRAHEAHKALSQLPGGSDGKDSTYNERMKELMHSDIALKHYKLSGLPNSEAYKQHSHNMSLHNEVAPDAPAPMDDYQLELAYNRKNPGAKKVYGIKNFAE